MTVSLPSALAAATRASMPPPPEADVCLDQSTDPAVLEEPHAATTSTVATAIPKRWIRCQFIPSTSPQVTSGCRKGAPGGAAIYCASTGRGARKHGGAPAKDRLSLGDVPNPGVGPVAEAPREVVGRLAGACDHLPQ